MFIKSIAVSKETQEVLVRQNNKNSMVHIHVVGMPNHKRMWVPNSTAQEAVELVDYLIKQRHVPFFDRGLDMYFVSEDSRNAYVDAQEYSLGVAAETAR